MKRVIYSILLTIALTVILMLLENRSNFPDIVIVPLITSLLIKYICGDWDIGYSYTATDIVYWFTIIGTSGIIVQMIKYYQIQN